jgi:hypothetical protein
MVAAELLPVLRNIDPETAMARDRRGSLDGKPYCHRVAAARSEIDVLARDLGRSIIVERQQVNLGGRHDSWDHAEAKRERSSGSGSNTCPALECLL